ncbi:MAG: hypothetical protein WCE30_27370 [Mycobacterium sp.]
MTDLCAAPTVQDDELSSDGGTWCAVWVLLAIQAVALTMQVVAVCMARQGLSAPANVLSCCGFGLAFASALWPLVGRRLDRTLRNAAVVCLGITSALQWRVNDPIVYLGYDEQLHLRTLRDIESAHRIFEPQALLPVSPRYPGLETLTALLNQIGLPIPVATMAVVVLARITLVVVLCSAVEHATGHPRAGGLAVAVYAISPQFVFFNSQFAYQTLSLPLALAAVALVARARRAQNTTPLLWGASACLLAVAMTHHLTSLLTAGFLVVWAMVEQPGQCRRRVAWAAVIAVLVTALWATVQWSLLRDYFGPMISGITDELRLGHRREPFAETAGSPKPWWERALLGYYALVIVSAISYLMLTHGRALLRQRRRWPVVSSDASPTTDLKVARWQVPALLLCVIATIPLLFGARVVPRFGELGDRASTFTYLAFSLFAAVGLEQWRRRLTDQMQSRAKHRVRLNRRYLLVGLGVRAIVVALAAGVFVGGYLLGSGAAWARLPGHYLPGADGRSVDAEMLAVADWARDALPAGSRVAADRMTSTLLSSRAGMWPVSSEPGGLDLASLYQADDWGPPQTEMASRANLRYLFVDDRIVGEKPYDLGYFDETTHVLLTRRQLAKFDLVPGIVEVYRHGPISVYDLRGVGVPEQRAGWMGTTHSLNLATQMVIGLSLGFVGVALWRTDIGKALVGAARSLHAAAGTSLAFASGVAALCVVSVVMLLARIWLGPAVFAAMALVVLVMNPAWVGARLSSWRRLRIGRWVPAALVTLSAATAIAISVWDADMAHRLGSPDSVRCVEGGCHE